MEDDLEPRDKQDTPSRPPAPLMGPPDPLGQWPLMGLPPFDQPGMMTPLYDPDMPPPDLEELIASLAEMVLLVCRLVAPFAAAAVLWFGYLLLSGRLR